MPRRRTRIPLQVFLNGRRVGMLRRESSGAINFQYDQDWLAWEHAMPVSLSLPLREDRFTGDPVVAVFENLLPDNDMIRRRLAERIGAEGYDAYSLLSAIGRDCVGALQFLPEGQEPGPAGHIAGRPADDEMIAGLLRDLSATPLGVRPDEDFRISIAGAQEKTALLYWKGQWHIPQGATPTTHILKPPIGRLQNGIDLSLSVENEHLCLLLTNAFGLPSAKTEITTFGDQKVLVVERFDRLWTQDHRLLRLPQEDCCQALSIPPSRKYEAEGGPGIPAIFQLLRGSDDALLDQRLFLKAQLVFWLLGATDGHAKNFSLKIASGRHFRLAPLYDVMSAQPNVDAHQIQRNKMKLAMAVGKSRHYVVEDIAARHFLQTAALCGAGESAMRRILEDIADQAPKGIETALQALPAGFPESVADSVITGLRRRLTRLLQTE